MRSPLMRIAPLRSCGKSRSLKNGRRFMTNRMKILVAYDGSECADAALDDLQKAGLPADTQIKVLSVIENWLPPPSGLEIIEHIDRDQEYLALARRGGMRLVPMSPGWDVKSEAGAGSP